MNHCAPLHLDSMVSNGRLAGTHYLLLFYCGAKRSDQLAVYDFMYNILTTCTTAPGGTDAGAARAATGQYVQRQSDGYSCRLFALAFVFSIAIVSLFIYV